MTPKTETLDAVCVLITGDDDAKFDRVKNPEQRVEIVKMALAAEHNELLDAIDTSLSHVGRWFELSRLYEP
ncbi:hypothetical protein P9A28_gp41 [Sphingomonas phage Eidolon]|uniref:Uncharacterized protein n=1 Tax=Sphingomonas phage Eidolon TaxID=2686311 RepID=A0A6M3T803_9CAUD|nr:hypothetical protein P9A28_gp41 [Sphingomonas phage Eidolon]QJD54427.1 hypothetical protein [Sphingomonas phage Eidolon]